MAVTLTTTQQTHLTLTFEDAKGNQASPDTSSPYQWVLTPLTLGTLTVAPDSGSAIFAAAQPGTGHIDVTVDADLGAGVTPVTGRLDVTVMPAQVAVVNVLADAPTEQ